MHWLRVRSGSSWLPAARAPGWATKARRGLSRSGRFRLRAFFRFTPRRSLRSASRHGSTIPLYIMTSPENHEVTVDFFEEHGRFGLDHVRFFTQGQMPAVDRVTGRVLLASKDRVALSPDGHGGTLAALAAPGPKGTSSCLDEMRERGVRTLFYFQVDNPLVRIAEPAFIGLHREANAEVSFKVIERRSPDEKLGVVVVVDGRPQVIEYSDLPLELAGRRVPEGPLELWAGSIAVHIFERSFIERLVGDQKLPFHRAIKKVACIEDSGQMVKPDEPNAVKFEQFIFDALPAPFAGRWSKPTGPASSSRSRTLSAQTRRRRFISR